LILIIVLLAYAIGSGIIGVELFPGAHAETPHVAMKVPEQTFGNWLWWQILWWCPVVFIAVASLTGCFWLAGHARDKWRLIHPENGVFPVVQMNTASLAERLNGVKQTTFVPVSVLGQEAATVRTHQGQTQISGGRADWTSTHQLTVAQNEQKTRLAAAMSGDSGIRNSAQAKLAAGYYDRAPKQIDAPAPANEDADPIEQAPDLLTLKQSVERSTPDAWIIGQNPKTGKLAYFKPDEAIHLAILGATGTGKTESTGMLVVGHALHNGYKVVIMDGKGGADWSKFAQWAEYHDTDTSNFASNLIPIVDEYQRRSALIKAESAGTFRELRNPPAPILILIEEYGDINDGLTGKAKEAVNTMLDLLIRKARNTGIHLVFIDQYPEKWEKQLLNNTKNKVVYWLNDGTIVKEFYVHQLAEQGEFFLKGERYNAWHVKPLLKGFMATVPMLDTSRLLVRPSVRTEERGEVEPEPPTLPTDKRTDGQADTVTDLQQSVLAWRRDNPTGTQADCIRALAEQGLKLSRQYASDLWKLPFASPMPCQQASNPTIQDLIAQYGEVNIGGERVTTAVDKTQEVKYR